MGNNNNMNNNNNNNNINNNGRSLNNICLTDIYWITLNKKGLIRDSNVRLNNKAAVYIYQFIKDESKIYIGSTINLAQRFRQHRYRISKNSQSCPIFYNFIKKYGWINFKFGVLEYLNFKQDFDKIVLLNREQYYLDVLSPSLNINKTAGSMLGFKHSEESIKLMRAAFLGRKHTEDSKLKIAAGNPKAYHVTVTNISTSQITEFISIRKASKFIGKNHSYIAKCLKNHGFYSNKFFTVCMKK